MRITAVATLAAALAAGGGAVWWAQHNSQEAILLDVCEGVLLERLSSPSTYKLIEASDVRTELAEVEDYLYNNDPEQKRRADDLSRNDPEYKELEDEQRELFAAARMEKLTITLKYDVDNEFGNEVRRFSSCSVFRYTDNPIKRNGMTDARVDGMSEFDWAINRLAN